MVFKPVANSIENAKLSDTTTTRDVMALPFRGYNKAQAHGTRPAPSAKQLDLFSPESIAPIASVELKATENLPVVVSSHAKRQSLFQHDPRTLEEALPSDGVPARTAEPAGASIGGSGEQSSRSAVSVPLHAEDAVPNGVGPRHEGMPAAGRAELVIE